MFVLHQIVDKLAVAFIAFRFLTERDTRALHDREIAAHEINQRHEPFIEHGDWIKVAELFFRLSHKLLLEKNGLLLFRAQHDAAKRQLAQARAVRGIRNFLDGEVLLLDCTRRTQERGCFFPIAFDSVAQYGFAFIVMRPRVGSGFEQHANRLKATIEGGEH